MNKEIEYDDLITDSGAALNIGLVVKQGLNTEQIKHIIELHNQINQIMRNAHEAVKEIEFQLQEAWGFEKDQNYHTHRFLIFNPPKIK